MPVDTKGENIRIRQVDPDLFVKTSFRNIDIPGVKGVKAVIGKRPGKDSTEVQSFIFDKDGWDIEKAKAWVAEHKSKATASLVHFDHDVALAIHTGKSTMAEAMRRNKSIQHNVGRALGLVRVQIDNGQIRRVS